MLAYKGYLGHVEFDDEAEIFHGEVINTRDVITFQGNTVAEIKKAFCASIDDYLAFCKERNEEPEKPFSAKLNEHIPPLTKSLKGILRHKKMNEADYKKYLAQLVDCDSKEDEAYDDL